MSCAPSSSGARGNLVKRILWFVVFLATAGLSQTKPAADLIITNAKIWTVDKAHPRADAVAVLRDRIVAVGSAAEGDASHGPQTKLLDAKRILLLPGVHYSHLP